MARLWDLPGEQGLPGEHRPDHHTIWTIETFPDPRVDLKPCGLLRTPGLICDPDRLLSNASRHAIQDRLERLAGDLTYVLGVAVMTHLDVTDITPSWTDWRHEDNGVELFARSLLKKWGLGHGGYGVMLVVSRDPDHVSVYAQHKASARALDQNLCRSIADYGVLPYVDNGYLDRGIVSGVEEIAVALRHPPEPMRPWAMSDKLFGVCCLVSMLAALAGFYACCCRAEDDTVLEGSPRRQA